MSSRASAKRLDSEDSNSTIGQVFPPKDGKATGVDSLQGAADIVENDAVEPLRWISAERIEDSEQPLTLARSCSAEYPQRFLIKGKPPFRHLASFGNQSLMLGNDILFLNPITSIHPAHRIPEFPAEFRRTSSLKDSKIRGQDVLLLGAQLSDFSFDLCETHEVRVMRRKTFAIHD
jgi:hypothetical protein